MARDPEYVRARVSSLLERYREGTLVTLDLEGKESERFWIPTWRLAEGDWVQGPFLPGRRFWYPPKPELVKVFPREADPVARELGQVVYTVAPGFGYQRSLKLGRDPDAFAYLLGEKPIDPLFAPPERYQLKEAKEQLLSWRWFFEALRELVQAGFTPLEGQRILDALGEPALDLVRKNPFLMTQVEGVDYTSLVARFRRRDPLGELLQRLKEEYVGSGNTAVPLASLAKSETEVQKLLQETSGQVRFERGYLALSRFADLEEEICENVREASSLPEIPPPEGLGEDQAPVVGLIRHRIGVLTGGPGTGKTYTLSRLVQALMRQKVPVTLVAPTGKAAQRMAQLAGIEARTVHSFLRTRPHEVFRTSSVRFPVGLVVLDEASMLDLETMVLVLRSLPEGASLLLVGDVDQLPPVQPGQPFADLLNLAPSLRLKSVRRQADPRSALLRAARASLEGIPWREVLKGQPEDFLYRRVREPDEVHALLRFLVSYYLDRGFGPEDVQVLTPVHEGPFGTKALNGVLREVFRQAREASSSRYVELGDGHIARVGEKIIFGENRFDYGVANGTTGIVEAIDDSEFTIRVGESYLVLPRSLAAQATLAYAITVHRSQGSEWRAVILVLPESPLTTRKLVYTGITRAKEQVVVLSTLDLEEVPLPKDRERTTWLNRVLSPRASGR